MVAIALAFGLTALIAPMEFQQVPRLIISIPAGAFALFAALAWDGLLSRWDGGILLVGFALALIALAVMSRRGLDIRSTGEVAETLESGWPNRWKSLGRFAVSLAAIIAGSELLVEGSEAIIAHLGLSETFFGMIVLAFLISVEEVARELPAALKGRPDITFGNIAGSILAFFGFNAGVIALVRPVTVESEVLRFYLPLCAATVLVISILMLTKRVGRWAGAVLVLLYLVFATGAIWTVGFCRTRW